MTGQCRSSCVPSLTMPHATIQPLAWPFAATFTPPDYKSITNRALVLAALAEGQEHPRQLPLRRMTRW